MMQDRVVDHPFLVLALELVTLLGGLPSAHPYSVYWVSSPNLGGDTVTIAGAGFSAETTVRLCTDPECAREQRESTPPWSSGWAHSIKFLLPVAGIEPPLWAQLCEGPCSHTAPPAYTVGVNRPQVSWLAGVCHQRPPAHGHVSPMGASVVAGSVLRVFGRSLAWDFHGNQSICRSATARGAATGTVLSLDGRMITAHAATCYEASFSLQGISVGHYSSATLRTIWGQTTLSITVTAAETASASQRIVLDVDEDFASDVPAALRRAAELPPSAWKIVQLGPRSYALNQSVRIPNRTSLIGHGRGISTLAFSLGEDAVATANTDTSELIWDAAITSDGPVPPTQCTGATAVARTTRQSARRPRQVVSSPCAADWALSNFSLLVLTAPAQAPKAWGTDSFGTKAIHARGVGFSILGLEIELRQANNSNALFVEGEGFEIAYNTFTQRNLCFWGDQHHQGMHDDSTDFVDSEVIQMHACTDGWFHNNTINWLCGGYTLNCCSHMIVEDNHIKSTEAGIEPHGNSIWQGDWRNYPSNNYWTFSHNTQTRPPHNNPANWAYHESLTTDGAGGWGSGKVVSVDGTTVTIDVQLDATDRWGSASPVGATALIVAGPGFGQSRQVVASTWNASSNTTFIVASSGWDHYVVPTKSILAVVVSSEGRLISGNHFTWGMVVQWFGTTLGGVIADNEFVDMHSATGGALAGRGLCYSSAPQPLYFAEYSGNQMIRSGGIDLVDDEDCSDPVTCCSTSFSGPYVRAQVVRRNSIAGISEITGLCGGIALHSSKGETAGSSTDIVVERNIIRCPNSSLLPGAGGGIVVNCTHCVVRN